MRLRLTAYKAFRGPKVLLSAAPQALSVKIWTSTFKLINMLSISASRACLLSLLYSYVVTTHSLPTLESVFEVRDEITPGPGVSNPDIGFCIFQLSLWYT